MVVRERSFISAISLAFATLITLLALLLSGPAFGQSAGQQSPMSSQAALPGPSDDLLAALERIYKDIHAHPELAFQETRTAGIAAAWLRQYGYEVTENVGGTGVVGVLRNGVGATVLLRADMDALPMEESTGLPYASNKVITDPSGHETPVAHMCGHDMHVTWLMGAARILAENRDQWSGTVMAVFQPAEETGEGARAMMQDGMVKHFPKPDVVLAQHVIMPMPAGQIGTRPGIILAMADSLEVTLFGRGGHASSPGSAINPVVMAAASIMQLQSIAGMIPSLATAVVTASVLQAGSSANIIPSQALFQLNVRTFDDQVRETVLSSIKRIVNAEAKASDAPKPPAFSVLSHFPLTVNDEAATRKVMDALAARFGSEQVQTSKPSTASEDVSVFAREWNVPLVYWFIGGTDRQTYVQAKQAGRLNRLPSNHTPEFAPVIDPTLRVGVEAMLAAAGAWLITPGAR